MFKYVFNLYHKYTCIFFSDSKPRFFRVNTLLTSLKDMLQKLSELKFVKLKTPTTYAELLELIKSDKFNSNTFVQDVHIKELLIFNSKVKFYKFNEYNNGFLILQDKVTFEFYLFIIVLTKQISL